MVERSSMQYLSSYYWQEEVPALTSLVLQQLVHRKKNEPFLFSCIAVGELQGKGLYNAHFVEQMTEWFRTEGRKLLFGRKQNQFEEIERELRKEIMRVDEELSAYVRAKGLEEVKRISVIGLLCVRNRFWLFQRGETRAYLLNAKFDRANCRSLLGTDNKQLTIQSGMMEPGIGLLLATEDFVAKLSKGQLEECLSVRELQGVSGIHRRLAELGAQARQEGARNMGAVLLVTK